MEWEVRVIEWMQNYAGTFTILLGKALAFIGDEKGLLIVILAVMFCFKKETGRKMAVIITVMLTWLAMIKGVVMRPRPYLQYPDRVRLLAKVESKADAADVAAQGYSFPSMHSATVLANTFTLAGSLKKKAAYIIAGIVTISAAISRIFVGAHYPTDVLAGLLIGLVSMYIYDLAEKHIRKQWLRTLLLLCTAFPDLVFVRTQDYFTSLGLLIALAAAIPFEDKYVNFQNSSFVIAKFLRLIGALVLYFVLNSLLKLPFNKAFLENGSFLSLLVRTLRYAIVMFVILGVYPMIFPLYEKIGKKKEQTDK